MILEDNLATTWTSFLADLSDKSLKEFVLNAIVKILKKIEKEDENSRTQACLPTLLDKCKSCNYVWISKSKRKSDKLSKELYYKYVVRK